jgi:hypothetical protein
MNSLNYFRDSEILTGEKGDVIIYLLDENIKEKYLSYDNEYSGKMSVSCVYESKYWSALLPEGSGEYFILRYDYENKYDISDFLSYRISDTILTSYELSLDEMKIDFVYKMKNENVVMEVNSIEFDIKKSTDESIPPEILEQLFHYTNWSFSGVFNNNSGKLRLNNINFNLFNQEYSDSELSGHFDIFGSFTGDNLTDEHFQIQFNLGDLNSQFLEIDESICKCIYDRLVTSDNLILSKQDIFIPAKVVTNSTINYSLESSAYFIPLLSNMLRKEEETHELNS